MGGVICRVIGVHCLKLGSTVPNQVPNLANLTYVIHPEVDMPEQRPFDPQHLTNISAVN